MINPYYSIAKRLLRLREKPLVVNRLGALWLLYPQDWIDNRILIGRPFETEQLDFAAQCITSNGITVFYDCGANIGLYSVIISLKIPELETHSFEPVPQTWGRLVSNITLNNLSDRVTPHKCGLGSANECLDISIDNNSSGCATFDEAAQSNPKRNFKQNTKVQISVFDEKFQDVGRKSFFKIDVEGYEAKTLAGMERYLKNNDCILQIELWDQNYALITQWLKERGYSVFHKIGADAYFQKSS